MAISDAQFTAWLSQDASVRCILVEAIARVSGVETTRYLSTRAYYDSVAGRAYDPIIVANSVQIVERISIDGESTLNFGDVELENNDGEIDSWLDDIWVNRAVSAYIGDVTWARSDFRPIFVGVASDIDSKNNRSLNIKIRDKFERLNTAVTENTLGGSTSNKNELLPLCFGECHNVTPLLADPATLDYRVHDGRIERIIEVRSNGAVAASTDTLTSGKFVPDVNPQGTKITVSVQGDDVGGSNYITTAKEIIERLVTGYGETTNQFSSGDLDATNLSAFDAANQQPLGVYLSSRENLKLVCDQIAASVGAQMVMSRVGELQLHTITLPAPGTAVDIDGNDVIDETLQIIERIPVVAAVKLGYNKNYSVQETIDTGIPQGHKDLYAKEWLNVTSEDATTKTNYRLSSEPTQIDTFLIQESDATTEADRRLALFKNQRHIISFRAAPRLIELQLGDPVTITHPRFGLSGGVDGMVVGMTIDWENLLVDLEVLI